LSRVLICDPANPDGSVIDETVAALIGGSVVVMPTETQYSLSIRADRETAPQKISAAKKRSESEKVALFVKDMDMARRFCEINEMAQKLADRHLPGPLTLVLPSKKNQDMVAAGFLSGDGFGIRISSSPLIAAVMNKTPFPVTATSANISGEITSDTIDKIQEALGEAVDLYLDAGPCRGIIPSTVVKVADSVTILRHGIIPDAEIRNCLGEGT
jgi:L-threonylcarbamoyladenylate synthase